MNKKNFQKQVGTMVCKKINYYWKRTSIIIPNIFKKIEVYSYKLSKKEFLQETYDLSMKSIPN